MKTFQAEIVQRFIKKGKDFDSFYEQYKEACKHHHVLSKPNANDQRIASHVRTTQSISKSAKALATSNGRIYSALARIAAYNRATN
jgi:hypothetical protein